MLEPKAQGSRRGANRERGETGARKREGRKGKRRGEARGTKGEVVTYNTTITTGAHLCVPYGWMLVIPKIFKITPNITQAKLKKSNLLKDSSSHSIISYHASVGYRSMSLVNLGS